MENDATAQSSLDAEERGAGKHSPSAELGKPLFHSLAVWPESRPLPHEVCV